MIGTHTFHPFDRRLLRASERNPAPFPPVGRDVRGRKAALVGIVLLAVGLAADCALRPSAPRTFALLEGRSLRLIASQEMPFVHGTDAPVPYAVRFYEIRAPYAGFRDALVAELPARQPAGGYFERNRSKGTTWHEHDSGATLTVSARETLLPAFRAGLSSGATGLLTTFEPVRSRWRERIEDGLERFFHR